MAKDRLVVMQRVSGDAEGKRGTVLYVAGAHGKYLAAADAVKRDSKEGIDRQERPGCATRGTLLNGIAGTTSPVACARNLEPCC